MKQMPNIPKIEMTECSRRPRVLWTLDEGTRRGGLPSPQFWDSNRWIITIMYLLLTVCGDYLGLKLDMKNMTDQKSPVYLAHCGLSPLYHGSGEIMHHLIDVHMKQGGALFSDYYIQEMTKAKTLLAQYLNTKPENMALVRNTTEALSMVANGYPWKTGDEVILYIHEYPANYYPWIIQQNKGVRVRVLKNHMPFDKIPSDLPGKWSWDELVNEVG